MTGSSQSGRSHAGRPASRAGSRPSPIASAGMRRGEIEVDAERRDRRLRDLVRLDRIAAAVEQHEAVRATGPAAHGRLEQPVAPLHLAHRDLALDPARSRDDEREALAVVGLGQAGDVDDADDLAVVRMADHRRRAGPALDAGAIVLGRMDLHRLADREGGADRVRAADALAPRDAGQQADALGRPDRRVVAFHRQDRAARVGERHHRAGLGQEVARAGHDRRAGFEQFAVVFLQRLESRFRDRRRCAALVGVDVVLLAALPRAIDERAQRIGRTDAAVEKTLPRGHHRRVVAGIGKHLPFGHPCHRVSPPCRRASQRAACERPIGRCPVGSACEGAVFVVAVGKSPAMEKLRRCNNPI